MLYLYNIYISMYIIYIERDVTAIRDLLIYTLDDCQI